MTFLFDKITPSALSDYRPSNLPRKSPREAQKHQSEVESMHRAYRTMLQREAKASALARAEQQQRDMKAQKNELQARERAMKERAERLSKERDCSQTWIQYIIPALEAYNQLQEGAALKPPMSTKEKENIILSKQKAMKKARHLVLQCDRNVPFAVTSNINSTLSVLSSLVVPETLLRRVRSPSSPPPSNLTPTSSDSDSSTTTLAVPPTVNPFDASWQHIHELDRHSTHFGGIPPKNRTRIWPLLVGNALGITRESFESAGSAAAVAREARQASLERLHAEAVRKNQSCSLSDSLTSESSVEDLSTKDAVDSFSATETTTTMETTTSTTVATSSVLTLSSNGKEHTFSYVDADLSRTFPSFAFFVDENSMMRTHLRVVLDTYCFYNPDMGYVQGMSYVAGNFLIYMDAYEAFVCLANLLRNDFFVVFLQLNESRMQPRYHFFEQLFRHYLPELYQHFENESVTPDLYFMEWSMTLFSKRLSFDVCGRVWDVYLVIGEELIYRAAVALLRCMNEELLTLHKDCPSLLRCLHHRCSSSIGEQQLMHAVSETTIPAALRPKLDAILQHSQQP